VLGVFVLIASVLLLGEEIYRAVPAAGAAVGVAALLDGRATAQAVHAR